MKMENNLQVRNTDGILTIDSREIAEMVGKRHAHLLRDIEGYIQILSNPNLVSTDFFIESIYQDNYNRTHKCYLLTKKGCDMVANKMTGEKGVLFSATYINRFYEMEKQLQEQSHYKIPKTYKEALLQLVEAEELKEKLMLENQQKEMLLIEQAPKVEKYERFLNSEGLTDMSTLAKILAEEFNGKALGRNKLMEKLRDMKVLTAHNTPYQQYVDRDYFVVKKSSKNGMNFSTTLITPKGIDWLVGKLTKELEKMRERQRFYNV